MKARAWDYGIMSLARELHMTRWQLLKNLNGYELSMWIAYFKETNKPPEKPKQSKEEVEGNIKNFLMMKTKGKKYAQFVT